MPTMPERMAAVETNVTTVKDDVAEIKGDVKVLLGWWNEERGARQQRALTNKRFLAVAGLLSTGLTVGVNLFIRLGGF